MAKSKSANKNKTKARQAPAEAAAATVPKQEAAKPAKAKNPTSKKASPKEKSSGGPAQWYAQAAQFFRECKVELKKVAWPTRKETIASTSVVLVLVMIAAAFLGLVDVSISYVIRMVIGPGAA